MTTDTFRAAHARNETLLMAWCGLGVPYAVELMGEAGYDAVLIDRQHGIGGNAELVACLTAARAAGLPALVRVSANEAGEIGRALDAGAQGVVCPLVNSAGDARALVEAIKYPPQGARSWGPYRGRLLLEGDYQTKANGWTIACAQIETRGAMDALDDILAVDGLDMALAGPNDLALGLTGERDIRAPQVIEAMTGILESCRRHGVIPAVFANDVNYAKPLAGAGWTVISVSTDAGLLAGAAAEIVRAVKG